MKFFAVIVMCAITCLVVALPQRLSDEQETKQFNQEVENCIAETKVEKATLYQFVKEFQENGEMIQDEKLHCFIACLLEKNDVIKRNGTIDKNTLLSEMPTDMPQKKINEATECIPEAMLWN
ncbi:general odorant-binding protein 83a-like [Copidosoma floridanum]|uniref:general odorant-binding protein 83a-like n=1 Tax=Copidosoma floridanum TaxID=29053 RepID=UPI000C6F4F64|nr:general odorant-binding protein 83a-like [Copidosoma floridanum]